MAHLWFGDGIDKDSLTVTELDIDKGSLTAQRYLEDIFEPHVMPFGPLIGERFTLMHAE